MTTEPLNTFRTVIGLWPTIAAFAADIGIDAGTARAWVRRDSIPSGWWLRVVEAALFRGFRSVSFRLLAELAARTPPKAANDSAGDGRVSVAVGDGFSMDTQMATGPAGPKGE